MAIEIIVTTAGRAALVNAVNTGTNAVTITQLGITDAIFAPEAAQVALPGEIKRIASVAGVVVADDQIHVTASDVTTDAYTMRGFALYLNDGTLFAIYGQAGAILNKTAESMMLLAADIAFADIEAELIEFGDTNFVLPPATTEIIGLVELATTAEAQAGADAQRALTPLTGRQSVLGWLVSQDGSGSGLDADLLDGLHASAFATAGHTHNREGLTGFGTMAGQNAIAVDIDGGSIDGTPIGAATAAAGRFTSLLATGGSSGFGALAPKGRVQISAGASSDTPVAGTIGNGVGLFITNSDPGYGLAFGIAGTGQAWLQSQRSDATGALYDILLNPIGGNVGIGTTSPNQKLDVRGASGVALQIANSGDASRGGKISVTGAGGAGAMSITTTSSGYAMSFGIDGAEKMRIGADGKVTFNQASANYQFNIAASNPSRGIIADIANVAGAGLNGAMLSFTQNGINNWCIGQVPGVDAFAFYRGRHGAADGQELARFGTTGEFISHYAIGAGVTPAVRLHAKGNLEILRLETTVGRGGGNCHQTWYDPAGRKGYFGFAGGDDAFYQMNECNAPMIFGTNGVNRWIIESLGNFIPQVDNNYLIGSPTFRPAGGYFAQFVNIGGNAAWHAGNDGAGSGLDADLLDGQQGAYYLPFASYNAADVLAKIATVDGSGSGLDADLLDGRHASEFVLGSSFAASFAQNGYQVLPNGLIIQWGRFSAFANQYTNASLPVAFPNQAFSAVVAGVAGGGADSQDNAPSITSLSTSQIQVFSADNSTTTMHFIAIGY